MEKSRLEILSEIQETLAGLKARIAEVENRLAELERLPEEPEAPAAAVEELALEVTEAPVAEVVAESVAEIVEEPAEEPEAEEEYEDLPEEEPMPEEDMSPIDISIDDEELEGTDFAEPVTPEPAVEPEPVAAPEPAAAPEPEPVGGLLGDEDPFVPKTSINDRQERKAKKVVMDVMGQKLAWKSAIPGTPVKNVISAISLNDRVLFINTLFKEDPMAFQDAIAAFNGMSSFAEAEEYVRANHPEWNLNSDLVFRLMMAVRRKLK